MDFEKKMAQVRQQAPRLLGEDHWQNYAICLPFFTDEEGQFSILFEERALQLESQPGEMAFPGGAVEAGEDFSEAARRETAEELLLAPEQVKLLAHPFTYCSVNGRRIECFVGRLEDYQGTYSKAEVASVLTLPWRAVRQWKARLSYNEVISRPAPGADFPYEDLPGGRAYPWRKGRSRMLFYHYHGKVIWGLTARILEATIALLDEKLEGRSETERMCDDSDSFL